MTAVPSTGPGNEQTAAVLVEPVEYRVVAAEIADYPDADSWTIKVAWRGDGRWAVILRSSCWNRRTKTWDYEMRPSSRTEAFLRTHRFDLDTALDIARQQAPLVVVNGMTPADLAVWHRTAR